MARKKDGDQTPERRSFCEMSCTFIGFCPMISRLWELTASPVSAAVTGQIDVCGEVPAEAIK